MHDLARIVSRSECAVIDDLQCNEMLPTVQHLSVVTDSAYCEDQNGSIPRNYKFEENLRNTVTSVIRLRTLVLIGQYDSFFFQSFQDILRKAHNLRLLQMSASSSDFNSFMCTLINPTHLRYLKALKPGMVLPQVLSKLFHLQVLDIGSSTYPTISNGINNLVSLRHIVAQGLSAIAGIGNMTSLLELHDFRVQNSGNFQITQLQSMNKLLQLGISQLDNVTTTDEAAGAKLRDKIHLRKLCLSWKYTYHSDIAREVLDGLEPHQGLKHLRIFGYNGATSPTWLATNIAVTSLQTLHLEDCGEWQILPSLEMLPFLTKLKLCKMQKVTEATFPSLAELILIEMPKLEKCSCTSMSDLNSSLRVLQIKMCRALKVFDLFENCNNFGSKMKSWLPGLRKLIIYDCPHLQVMHPLPPSTNCYELFISRVSTFPKMERSSRETLEIGCLFAFHDVPSYEMRALDDRRLAFHNLRDLKYLCITYFRNLMSIPFKGFSQLVSLKSLKISDCEKLFCSDIPEYTYEDVVAANCIALPYLEHLHIHSCGITGKWLSLMLRHAPALLVLKLGACPQITQLSIEEEENSQSNLISTLQASSSGNRDYALASSVPEGLLRIPLTLVSTLQEMDIAVFPHLTFKRSMGGLSGFNSLEKLTIWYCPELLSSLVHIVRTDGQMNGRCLLPQSLGYLVIGDYSGVMLQPCFPRNLTCLKKFQIWSNESLESLQLHSCTALEELNILGCPSLTSLEGIQSVRHLSVFSSPSLPPYLEHFSRQGYALYPQLEKLVTDDPCILTTPFCKQLTSLQRLELRTCESKAIRLTDEQERALLLVMSLQELQFWKCSYLMDLPGELHRLPFLKKLEIGNCQRILWLPEKGLPPSLEELNVSCHGGCSKMLAAQSRALATSKLKVKIDGKYVN